MKKGKYYLANVNCVHDRVKSKVLILLRFLGTWHTTTELAELCKFKSNGTMRSHCGLWAKKHVDKHNHVHDGILLRRARGLAPLPLRTARPLRPVFVVPGATPTSAAVDHARTVARRAERHVVRAVVLGHLVNPEVVRYLNRLSDLLFVVARHAAGDVDEAASRG